MALKFTNSPKTQTTRFILIEVGIVSKWEKYHVPKLIKHWRIPRLHPANAFFLPEPPFCVLACLLHSTETKVHAKEKKRKKKAPLRAIDRIAIVLKEGTLTGLTEIPICRPSDSLIIAVVVSDTNSLVVFFSSKLCVEARVQ